MGAKRVTLAAGMALAAALTLAGCNSGPPAPSFEELCSDQGGSVMADSTTKLMTGIVTGTVITSNGGVSTGTGVATSPVTFTVKLCIKRGDVIDMEVD